jgi:hypothetical protein
MSKRTGRPAIDPKKRKEVVFKFYATKIEAARLRNRAGELGKSISEYLRNCSIPQG